MSDLPPRPAFWPYLPGYALLLLSVLLCASGSYRFVTPMALADGVDLVYLSQGLALLPLGTGLVGLLAGFLLHVRGRWLGALLALLAADGGGRLRQAAEAVKAGDHARAQAILQPVLQTEQAQALLQKLDG